MNFTVRILHPADAALYRDIRLEGLRLHPDAFGASFEQEAAQPLEFFVQRLTSNTIFAGFAGKGPLGIGGFIPEAGVKRAHKGHFWGMYVRQEARGTGLARQLVETVLDYARDRVELIQLSVTAHNQAARRLYTSLGFEPYGIDVRALLVEGRYLDEIHMVKMLA